MNVESLTIKLSPPDETFFVCFAMCLSPSCGLWHRPFASEKRKAATQLRLFSKPRRIHLISLSGLYHVPGKKTSKENCFKKCSEFCNFFRKSAAKIYVRKFRNVKKSTRRKIGRIYRIFLTYRAALARIGYKQTSRRRTMPDENTILSVAKAVQLLPFLREAAFGYQVTSIT